MLSLLYTLVKLAKSHYLLLSFVCILYIVFVCLFKLFVCIFNFLLPLVVNKDVHLYSNDYSAFYFVQLCPVLLHLQLVEGYCTITDTD